KHVLVEKPIDINTDRVDELISVCEHERVKLGVFFQDRTAADIRTLKRLIDSGELGSPIIASARVKWHRPAEYYSGSRWRGTWELDGGGALMNQGIHTVDLLLWLIGDVSAVSATIRTALHQIEAEDTSVALLEFSNGAIGTLEAATSVYPGFSRRLELTWSEGTIVIENDQIVDSRLRDDRGDLILGASDRAERASSNVLSDSSRHRAIIEDFLKAIRDGSTPLCDGREGRRSVEVVQAIYQASKTGGRVTIGAAG